MVVHNDFVAPTVRGDERERFDLGFEFFEQFGRQANGPVGIVSNRAVGNLDINRH
jgi:hypothetical protein